jgi:hypothetical protein
MGEADELAALLLAVFALEHTALQLLCKNSLFLLRRARGFAIITPSFLIKGAEPYEIFDSFDPGHY